MVETAGSVHPAVSLSVRTIIILSHRCSSDERQSAMVSSSVLTQLLVGRNCSLRLSRLSTAMPNAIGAVL